MKYAKIYFENEEWCAKLKDDEYISENLMIRVKEGEEDRLEFIESEMYPLDKLMESGLNYEKITEKEYKESIIQKTQQQFENEIASLYEKIEKLKKERENILRKY